MGLVVVSVVLAAAIFAIDVSMPLGVAELCESEELLSQITETIEDVFWITDWADQRTLFASQAYERIWDRSLQDLYADARNWADAIHPEDRKRAWEVFEQLGEGDSYDEEYRIVRPDGSMRWIRDRGFPVRDVNGSVYRVAGIAQDITERRQAEAELRESEGRIRALLKGAFEGIAISEKGRILECNRAFADIFGYALDEIVELSAADLTTPKSAQKVAQRIASGDETAYEVVGLRKDGTTFDLELLGRNCLYRGRVARITAMRDVTESKRAEEALRESEERLDLAVRGTSDGMWDWGLESGEVYWSPRLKELLGYGEDEVEADYGRFVAFMHPEDRAGTLEALRLHMEENQTFDCEFQMRMKSGEYRWFQSRGEALRDDNGKPYRMAGSIRDIADRKQAEEENRRLQENLRQAQKMEAVGQLAAGVAHEFNNILVGVRSNAEFLLRTSKDLIPDELERPLKDIERSGARAFDLTQQLLSFARKKSPNLAVFDVNRVVTSIETMLQRFIGTNITLETQLSPDPVTVHADEAEIEQALMNLVMNARDAMPERGTLTIRTRIVSLEEDEVPRDCQAGRFVQLSVADDGCGMLPETVERIFEPFFTTKPVGSGTGLGLSTVYSDIAKSDGFVSVESREGSGTVVYVHLPQSQGSVADERAETERSPSNSSGGGETILVCDDDQIVLGSVMALLKSVGYSVIGATCASEA